MIRPAGYTANEKLQICRRYIVERQREQNGLSDEEIHFSNPALKALIQGYTREAGVRGLERQVGTVCRKVARRSW